MKKRVTSIFVFFVFFVFCNAQETLFQQLDSLSAVLGKDNVNLFKAMAYENGDGAEKDPLKALEFYNKAFLEGNPISAYKIGMMLWKIEGTNPQVLESLKPLLGGNVSPAYYFSAGSNMTQYTRNRDIANLLGVIDGVYLFLHGETEKSIEALTKREEIQKNAIAQIYLSFAYFKIKKIQLAELFLNRACNNPQKPEDVKALCNSDKVKRLKIGE